GASSTDFLRIVGHLVYGYFWSRAAQAAWTRLPEGDPLRAEKLATARFYFEHLFPETEMRLRRLFVPAERYTNPCALAV
ncbi:MAG: acyl-CoA dehydrogenase, partial [Achromobacter sp.]|nr:acyl-CoA dehydrogenase [Achromobacter sp.]